MKGIQDTSSKTYRSIMGNGLRYEIPKFQRDYTWEEEQWDDLWQDIGALLEEEESEHYMGYLVLQTSNNKNFHIIDGQQRLTTLSILILSVLKTLNDLIEAGQDADNNKIRRDSLMNSYIGYIDPVTLTTNNKLKLNRNSDDYYRQHLVLLKELPVRKINSSEKHMRECFHWFYDKVKKQFTKGEALAKFIDDIVDKLSFTVIEVSDQLNAFKVFETLNARGVQLSSADLLKNYLFSVADESKPHSSEIEELENLWSKIVGKLGENKFEDYLRYYWNSSNRTVSKRNLFKTIKQEIKTKGQVFSLVRDLDDTADLFLACQNPEDEFWQKYPEIRTSLKELKLFQIKQTSSLFIAGLKHLDMDQFKKLADVCSVISFRYNVIGGLNPNAQEVVYNQAALFVTENKRFDMKLFQSIYVSDTNFVNYFSTKEFKSSTRNHKIVKYLLSKIEDYQFKSGNNYENDAFSVEHILPENSDDSWGDFNYDAINRYVYRIGNLTLLEKKYNRDAAQKSYLDKLKIYEKSNSKLTKVIAENYESWNESNISNRQEEMAKHAKSIWRVQELAG